MEINVSSRKKQITFPKTRFTEELFGLRTQSCMRVFKAIGSEWLLYNKREKRDLYERRARLLELAQVSHSAYGMAKKVLIEKGFITSVTIKVPMHGSNTHINLTEKGLALYYKILNSEKNPAKEKIQREKQYHYNADHERVARFWYVEAKKYWLHQEKGRYGHLKDLGNWEENKDARSDTIRRSCKLLQVTPDELLEMMKAVISRSADFYFSNVLGPTKFLGKKWNNGLYPVESLRNHYEQIQASDNNQQKKKEEKILVQDRDYIEGDMGEEENNRVRVIWDTMFESLGDKLQVYYSTVQAKEDAALSLSSLCDRLEYFTNPSFGGVDWWQNDNRNGEKYWKFILKEYKKADIITPEMLWQKWLKFWQHNGVNLGYGHTLKDFYVPDYTKEV